MCALCCCGIRLDLCFPPRYVDQPGVQQCTNFSREGNNFRCTFSYEKSQGTSMLRILFEGNSEDVRPVCVSGKSRCACWLAVCSLPKRLCCENLLPTRIIPKALVNKGGHTIYLKDAEAPGVSSGKEFHNWGMVGAPRLSPTTLAVFTQHMNGDLRRTAPSPLFGGHDGLWQHFPNCDTV